MRREAYKKKGETEKLFPSILQQHVTLLYDNINNNYIVYTRYLVGENRQKICWFSWEDRVTNAWPAIPTGFQLVVRERERERSIFIDLRQGCIDRQAAKYVRI